MLRLKVAALLSVTLFMSTASGPSQAEQMAFVPPTQAHRESFITNKCINWHQSLDEAKQSAVKEKKLIFWVHMLGTMDGAT